jgi:hypothetical protein
LQNKAFRGHWIKPIKDPTCMNLLVSSETQHQEFNKRRLFVALEDVWWEVRARTGKRQQFLHLSQSYTNKRSKRC